MKMIYSVLSLSFFVGISLSLCSGCHSIPTKDSATSAQTEATTVATAPKKDALSTWLATAAQPAVVPCSVERELAPNAVDGFNAIAGKVAELYATVYADAQSAETAMRTGDISLDNVLSKVASAVTTDNADWKTSAQTAVITTYQAAMQEVETQSKQLTEYTRSLRTDESILSLENRAEQIKVLVQLGNDSTALGAQLKETCEGASAIRARRIATALGK